ncbi:hypothetical protein QBK99_14670 [Corticibacterium sp. UT-5YL-CI-8]|nr:hypothetical protein [Tianweitania sp. UT-5YL-CI-8]
MAVLTGEALAHASERGHVLLLPTGYYIVGAVLAVFASFLVLAVLPPKTIVSAWSRRLCLGEIPDLRAVTSTLSFVVLMVLVAAGIWGSRDPLSNPLPLVVWTLLWIGVTLMQGAMGDFWSWINPWYGPYRVVMRCVGFVTHRCRRSTLPPSVLPDISPAWGEIELSSTLSPTVPAAREAGRAQLLISPHAGEMSGRTEGGNIGQKRSIYGRLAYTPALLGFLAFAWFELIYPAPDDPFRLAIVVALYWAASFAGMLLFSYNRWSRQGEFLTAFFSLIARFSILDGQETGGRIRLSLNWPGAKLLDAAPLPLSGTLFLLLALSSVSFDGLSKTFFWLGLFGINPLEYPGRSALVWLNSFGLLATFAVMVVVTLSAVALGERLVASRHCFRGAAGLLVWSFVPIALAYHASHYVASLLVNGQYALVAVSDPFALGWNLFGTANHHVEAAIVAGAGGARLIWNVQVAAIVGGHVLAVLAAHALAHRLHPDRGAAIRSQIPLTVLMLAYTALGLWLLSTPTAG